MGKRKVIFCGNGGVGKSYCMYKMAGVHESMQSQGDVDVRNVMVGDRCFHIWDLSSKCESHIANIYFLGADYVFIFYNSSEETLEDTAFWKEKAPAEAEIFYVDTYGIDLTALSKQDIIDATVGRIL